MRLFQQKFLRMFRGRPFDSEGGLALLVGTDYLFSSRAQPENYFRVNPGQNIIFNHNNFLKKQKKKKKKKKMGGGGGGCSPRVK